MSILYQALKTQWGAVKRNPLVSFLLIFIMGEVIFVGNRDKTLIKAIAYLLAMWFCSLVTDMYVIWHKPKHDEFLVKQPLKETIYAVTCTLLGILFLMFRFVMLDWNNTPGPVKLAILPLIFFTFPVILFVILLLYKYKLKDMGFRFSNVIFVAVLVILVTAVTAYIVAPAGFTFRIVYRQAGGLTGLLIEGFITAALPEEFTRLILQTRLGALFNSKSIGWFFASFIWACMHIPAFYAQHNNLPRAVMGALQIIPLGLLWGYMTFRTKNIFPAILTHGINMWGLQIF